MNDGRIAPGAPSGDDRRLIDELDLVEETVQVAGSTFEIVRPRSAEALIDQEDYERDERLPYWAEPWPSGRILAEALVEHPLAGRRLIELGCGLALPTLVAARAGAHVLATDWYPSALAVLRENARRNDVRIETADLDWMHPSDEVMRAAPFELVVAADVLYELRYAGALTALVPRLAGLSGEALIADPRRPYASDFVEGMLELGWTWELNERRVVGRVDEAGPIVRLHRLRPPQDA